MLLRNLISGILLGNIYNSHILVLHLKGSKDGGNYKNEDK